MFVFIKWLTDSGYMSSIITLDYILCTLLLELSKIKITNVCYKRILKINIQQQHYNVNVKFYIILLQEKKSSLLILPEIATTTLSNERPHYRYMYLCSWLMDDGRHSE